MPPTIALTSFRQTVESRRRAHSLTALFLSVAAASCSSNSATITAPSPSKCELSLDLASITMEASGGTGRLVVTTAPECTWTATTRAAWISGISPASGQGSGGIEFRVAANSLPSAREGDVAVNDQRAVVRQQAAACRFEVAPDALDVSAGGGPESITVTTLAGCAWSAAGDVDWIAVAPSTGTGSDTLRVDIAPNNGLARDGTLRVADRVVAVRQSAATATPPRTCNAAIAPRAQTVGVAGGAGGPVAVSAPAGCTWTAVSNAPWISITAGQSGNGPGAVTYNVAANGGSARSGTLTIAGETFVVTQSGVASCSYTVSPTTQSVGSSGGVPPAVQVLTTSNCAWTATSNVSWVTVLSGASGTGNGTVTHQVSANPGNARTATLMVAGQPVTITQEAAACSYAISPSRHEIGAAGGAGTPIALTTGPACTWTAASDAQWITITSPRSGTGNTTVTYTVAANTGDDRRGLITVGGQTFTVDQAKAAPSCTYSIAPTTQSVAATGGSGTVTVTSAGGCAWNTTSNAPWITVTSGQTGSGNGSVVFLVSPNVGASRSGTLTIAGQTFTVTQDALIQCVYVISPTSYRADEDEGMGPPITVATTSGCAWTATSNVDWIRITAGESGSGPGTVRFRVEENDGQRREGTLTIAGQTFTVTQSKD